MGTITLSWQSVITISAVVTALFTLLKHYNKAYDMVKHQKEQDETIKSIKDDLDKNNRKTQEEFTLLTYGVLACLKGLKEQGCDGLVSEAIDKIEKHLNQAAHGQL